METCRPALIPWPGAVRGPTTHSMTGSRVSGVAPTAFDPPNFMGEGGASVEVVLDGERERCGDCRHGEPKRIRGEETGFVLCPFTSKAHWYAGRLPCQLAPPRYERRTN